MKVGVAPGRFATAIHAALSQRADLEAHILSPEIDSSTYNLVVAVDDEPTPPKAQVRRYITQHMSQANPWTVVAARHLLREAVGRGTATPIVAPLPISAPVSISPPKSGIGIVDAGNHKALRTTLEAASMRIFEIDDPDVGIIIDPSTSLGFVEPLRAAMSQEKVVIAMHTNEAAKDTIVHDTNGYLLTQPSQICPAAEALAENTNERSRLGFEARKSIATANWQRVVRALLLATRTGTPDLEQFSDLPARKRWSKRLGHAHEWRSSQYADGNLKLRDRTIDLKDLGSLRKASLARAIGKRDQ